MVEHEEIETVIKMIKVEVGKFREPVVTRIGRKRNPFHVLVSCLLSLRTKDTTTGVASAKLFSIADTPEKMAKLNVKAIEKLIYPVGFYKTKARRIKKICKILVDKYKSKVPDDFDELMKFKGVGRKTANIVMVYGFNKAGIPVDVHVHIIANRLDWAKTSTPEKTEFQLRRVLPKKYWLDINNLFVIFGQNVCLTRKPKCDICPITEYCNYYKRFYSKLQK